jgi:hypothetical protein
MEMGEMQCKCKWRGKRPEEREELEERGVRRILSGRGL